MIALNRVQLIGFLTENPNVRQLEWNVSVADVNLVVKNVVKNKDWQDQEMTSFHNITVWRWLADVIKNYTRKWSQIYVSWRLETDSWEDPQWNKKYKTKVIAEDIILLSKKDASQVPSWNKIMSWMNKAEVIWNITWDIELRTTPNGTSVTSFWVATNRQWKAQDWTMNEKAEFHNIVAWEKIAENIVQFAKKWSKVYIAWRVQSRSWDAPDGTKKYTTEIIADSVRILWFVDETMVSNWWTSNENSTIWSSSQNAKPVSNDIPEIDYSTDIKPEDLPF